MKKIHRIIFIILLLISMVLFALISCDGDDGSGGDVTQENVTDLVREALAGLNTYETELELTMDLEGEVGGEKGEISISVRTDGVTDLTAKTSMMNMELSMKMKAREDSMDESARMTAYIVDDMYYVGTADNSGSMVWDSQSALNSIWEQQEQTGQFMELLEGSKVSSLKTEKVDGIPCYLVEIVPDPYTLWELVLGQSGDFSEDVDIDLLGGYLKKVTVKYWFDQDTMFFNRVYVYLDMEFDEEQLGEEGEIRFITEMTIAFQEHNASVDITVPEEALTGQ